MGAAPFTCSVATKEEAIELLKNAELIDLYNEECTDSWSNFMARKDHAYRPATVKNIEEYTNAFNAFISKVPKQLQDVGDIKIVSETAELMYHAAGVEVWDRLTAVDAKKIYETLAACDIPMDKIVMENTNISPEVFSMLKRNTTFFNRADLIHLGIMEDAYTF